jgi:hypothetical protein
VIMVDDATRPTPASQDFALHPWEDRGDRDSR